MIALKKNIKINISEEPRCKGLESIGSVFMPLMKGVLSTDDLILDFVVFGCNVVFASLTDERV